MNYFDNLIIGPVERPTFRPNPIHLAIQQNTGRPDSHNEQAVAVDYADIIAEYIATMVLGG